MRSDATHAVAAALEPQQVIPLSTGSVIVIVQPRHRLIIPRSLYRRAGLTGQELIVCGLMDDGGLVVGTFGLVLEMERRSVLTCAADNDGIRLPPKAIEHLRLQPGDTVLADIGYRHLSLVPYHRRADGAQRAMRKRGRTHV